jgi:hypothetical protein
MPTLSLDDDPEDDDVDEDGEFDEDGESDEDEEEGDDAEEDVETWQVAAPPIGRTPTSA